MRIFMVGATGTIGRAALRALVRHGHEVVAYVRPESAARLQRAVAQEGLAGVTVRAGEMREAAAIARDGLAEGPVDAVVSCMASRTGAPDDAWAVDHRAHLQVLEAATAAGASHFVLLSAICVQKPVLAFQQAKLAFEAALQRSGLTWSIVRPTAFFKSLSGQVARVRQGKPFLVFGDGTLTACKPISDDDLGEYLARCVTDPALRNRILPIGGPGPALTPREQGEQLFALVGKPPRFSRVPVALLDAIIAVLGTLGAVVPPLRAKAELARIGRYYATESMLIWDAARGRYDADATPEFGTERLADHWAGLLAGDRTDDRGAHAVF
ncbi:MAG: NAD(P)H-binding protein [Gemmatimonadota bacterium]|jgi:divinyl chlorophyllide a 8-vinyl-reductase|nr:NAD(P)H-binding protein [Gemmatimonadota bacterium]